MDKITKTIFLLVLIAVFMQTYLLNGESHSESSIFFAVPITINVLLLSIYIFQKKNLAYKKTIGNILIYCVIISAIYFIIFEYLFQLSKVFKN